MKFNPGPSMKFNSGPCTNDFYLGDVTSMDVATTDISTGKVLEHDKIEPYRGDNRAYSGAKVLTHETPDATEVVVFKTNWWTSKTTPLAYGKKMANTAAQTQQNIAASMVPSPAGVASLTTATGSPGISDSDNLIAITPDGKGLYHTYDPDGTVDVIGPDGQRHAVNRRKWLESHFITPDGTMF